MALAPSKEFSIDLGTVKSLALPQPQPTTMYSIAPVSLSQYPQTVQELPTLSISPIERQVQAETPDEISATTSGNGALVFLGILVLAGFVALLLWLDVAIWLIILLMVLSVLMGLAMALAIAVSA